MLEQIGTQLLCNLLNSVKQDTQHTHGKTLRPLCAYRHSDMDTHAYSQTHIERHKHILSSIDTKIHTTDERTQYVLNTILLRSIKSRQWDPGGEQRDNVVEGTKEFELCSTQDLAAKCNSYRVQCTSHKCGMHRLCTAPSCAYLSVFSHCAHFKPTISI